MYFKTKDERIFDLDPSKVFIQEELINKVLRYLAISIGIKNKNKAKGSSIKIYSTKQALDEDYFKGKDSEEKFSKFMRLALLSTKMHLEKDLISDTKENEPIIITREEIQNLLNYQTNLNNKIYA
jgi:hypothetical protein